MTKRRNRRKIRRNRRKKIKRRKRQGAIEQNQIMLPEMPVAVAEINHKDCVSKNLIYSQRTLLTLKTITQYSTDLTRTVAKHSHIRRTRRVPIQITTRLCILTLSTNSKYFRQDNNNKYKSDIRLFMRINKKSRITVSNCYPQKIKFHRKK